MARTKRKTEPTEPTHKQPYRYYLGQIVRLHRHEGDWMINGVTYYGYRLQRIDTTETVRLGHIYDEDVKEVVGDGWE